MQLHERIMQVLREEIRRLEPGSRLPTDRELAARFDVSNVTVRSALMQLADEGYVRRRQGSGTYVLPRRNRQHVGIVVELNVLHPRTSTFYLRATLGIQAYFQQREFQTRLYIGGSTPDQPGGKISSREFYDDLAADRLLGLAVLMGDIDAPRRKTLEKHHVPIVGFPTGYPFGVTVDVEGMVRDGIAYLAEAGCRRIGVIGWTDTGGPDTVHPAKTLAAAEEALAQAGLPFDPAMVLQDIYPGTVGAGRVQFDRLWQTAAAKPDGLLFTDDCLFRDALPAIYEAGLRIPQTLKVAAHATRGSDVDYPSGIMLMEIDPADFVDRMSGMLESLVDAAPPRPRLQFVHARCRPSGVATTE